MINKKNYNKCEKLKDVPLIPFAVYNSVHIYVQNQEVADYFSENLKLKEVEQGAMEHSLN
jgi:hypothetical protein